MKSILIAFSLALSFSVNAGAKEDVKIRVTKNAFLIPFGDITFPSSDPCYAGQTVKANRFSISKIITTWSGEGNFRPTYMLVTIPETDKSAKFQCVFSAASGNDSIAQSLGFPNDEVNKNDQDSVTAESVCSIHCGSFPLIKNSEFGIRGKVKLYGIVNKTVKGQPVEEQVTAEDYFDLLYQP